ncbi:hypothetical protein [Streptomyces sp. NPDC059979]|uniref:hypothetical protein n=1 Tax=unclassified Streptomyces TaxID=2593676 RepID=UPI00366956EE
MNAMCARPLPGFTPLTWSPLPLPVKATRSPLISVTVRCPGAAAGNAEGGADDRPSSSFGSAEADSAVASRATAVAPTTVTVLDLDLMYQLPEGAAKINRH